MSFDSGRNLYLYLYQIFLYPFAYIGHILTTSVAASSGSKVLHSILLSATDVFFVHAECFLFLSSNKLAAPKLYATVIKEQASIIISLSFAILLKRSSCGFLGL